MPTRTGGTPVAGSGTTLSLSLSLFLSLPQLWMNHVECRMSCRDLIRGYRTCHSEMSTACRTVWPAPAECARSPASDVMHSKWKRDLERDLQRERERVKQVLPEQRRRRRDRPMLTSWSRYDSKQK